MNTACGELFLVGLHGPFDRAAADALRRLRPSGVILFRRDAADRASWDGVVESIWRALEPEGVRPLIAADEEGGFVSQLPPPFTPLPSPMAVARGAGPEEI